MRPPFRKGRRTQRMCSFRGSYANRGNGTELSPSDVVPVAGVEPARVISPTDFESVTSANSITPACASHITISSRRLQALFQRLRLRCWSGADRLGRAAVRLAMVQGGSIAPPQKVPGETAGDLNRSTRCRPIEGKIRSVF